MFHGCLMGLSVTADFLGQIFVFFRMFFGPNFGPNFGRLVSCESCECNLNGAAVGKDSHVKFTRSYDNRMLVGGTLLKPRNPIQK